jgi:hypothetical protein
MKSIFKNILIALCDLIIVALIGLLGGGIYRLVGGNLEEVDIGLLIPIFILAFFMGTAWVKITKKFRFN